MDENKTAANRARFSNDELAHRIRACYNISDSPFAFIAGGLRRIAVNPEDRRAQMQLLRHGVRYYSKVQTIVYQLNRIFQPDVFLDVGSNYGECLFSLPLNSGIRAIGFEANPQLIPYLDRSRLYNDDLSVELIDKAVGASSEDGSISFFVNANWSGKSTAASGAVSAGMKEIVVPLTTIDEEIEARVPNAQSIVMKVDVEGFEPQVIAGAAASIERSDLFVCLSEFNNQFIDGGDAGARAFFQELSSLFKIYHAGKNVAPVASYDDLVEMAGKQDGGIHCDLLLVKSSEDHLALFENNLCHKNLQKIANEMWNLDIPAKRRVDGRR